MLFGWSSRSTTKVNHMVVAVPCWGPPHVCLWVYNVEKEKEHSSAKRMRYTTCSSLLVNYRLDSHQSFVMFFCGCGGQQLFDLNVYYILLSVVEIVIFFLCTQTEQKNIEKKRGRFHGQSTLPVT